jgi:adenosine deaminase
MGKFANGMRAKATEDYHSYLCGFADAALENYLQAIRDHILPIMQTKDNLDRITQERIEDAVADGHIALELRFAPQLHIAGGLTLDDVLTTVAARLKTSPIVTDLTVCALRHEKDMKIDGVPYIRALGDLCIKYPDEIGCFDLAGGEGVFPGILDWWMEEAIRVSEARRRTHRPIVIKCHLWEANDPTLDDYRKLSELDRVLKQGKLIVGHGIRDRRESTIYKEVCVTSEIVTRQTTTFGQNPINEFVSQGHRAYLNTDGTLFTRTTLSREYDLAQSAWGWGPKEFLQTNVWALEAMNLPPATKSALFAKLTESWF